jgi:hypothetical protein
MVVCYRIRLRLAETKFWQETQSCVTSTSAVLVVLHVNINGRMRLLSRTHQMRPNGGQMNIERHATAWKCHLVVSST